MGRILASCILALCAAWQPAQAQTRSVVVPAESAVVIAPRGQAAPRPSMAPPTLAQRRFVEAAPQQDTLNAPAAAAVIGLAGAAALAVILGGGGGSSSSPAGATAAAPSRTR